MNKKAEIILVGTFHYPGVYDIFSDSVQKEIEEFTDRLALLQPTKIAVEFPCKMQETLDVFYKNFEEQDVKSQVSYSDIAQYNQTVTFDSLNEIVQVGFRLGNKLNHSKIYGVDEDIEMSAELGDKVFPHVAIDEYLEK